MKDFTFTLDQKISMWTRSTKRIKAETHEDAVSILKNQYYSGYIFDNLDNREYIYETQEDIEVIEVLDSDGNTIKI